MASRESVLVKNKKKSQPPPRILVVEDERIVAMGLQSQLQGLGYEVVGLATSGEDAVAQAVRTRPDLVLMDIHLDGAMDGVEAADIIRRRTGTPAVYLTAYSDQEVVERAKLTEPLGYLLKPFEERELSVAVEIGLYRRCMERKLRAQKRLLGATLRSIGDGVIATDRHGRVRFLNPVAEKMTGWTRKDARGRPIDEVVALTREPTGEPVESPLQAAMRDRVSLPMTNHTALVSQDLTLTPVDDCASPITDKSGELLGGVMVFRDVSQRRAAMRAMAKLAAVVASSDDPIIATTNEGMITSWNAAAERVFGYTIEEAAGCPLSLIVSPRRKEELEIALGKVIQGNREPSFETEGMRKDGSIFDILVTVSPIHMEDGQILGTAAIARDVTRLNRLKDELLQAQKMETVGRLAGGIAHDFNNLLTIINGYADIVMGSLAPADRNREMLGEVIDAGKRAAALTGQLLAYSRKQMLRFKVIDLNELISGAESMLRRVIGEDVEISIVPAANLSLIKVDPDQIGQVLMNLVINARDAMPTGGSLTIQTANVDLLCAEIPYEMQNRTGPHVRLDIADTGCGMSEETMSHLFEPFFTTKELGKGTGLGLATVQGIVKQCGGFIEAQSQPGKGTRFQIYFPATAEFDVSDASKERVGNVPTGSETILLVEDEAGVRNLAQQFLRNCGYHVLVACGGEEAAELARIHGKIDLIVTDVVMPHMSGPQVVEALKKTHPETAVLFQSGYTEDVALRHGVASSERNFLQKPFGVEQLANKVREILDRQKRVPTTLITSEGASQAAAARPNAAPGPRTLGELTTKIATSMDSEELLEGANGASSHVRRIGQVCPLRDRMCPIQEIGRKANGAATVVCTTPEGSCQLLELEAFGHKAMVCTNQGGVFTEWQLAIEEPATDKPFGQPAVDAIAINAAAPLREVARLIGRTSARHVIALDKALRPIGIATAAAVLVAARDLEQSEARTPRSERD